MNNNRLEEIKSDYDTIKIPEYLKQNICKTMEQAKKDTRYDKKAKKERACFVFTRITATAIAAMFVITLLSNVNPSMSQAMGEIPVIGKIAKVVTFRSFVSEDNDMSAHVKTPQIEVKNKDGQMMQETTDQINKTVREYTDQVINEYKRDVEATGGKGRETVTTDYKVVTDNDFLFSLRINTTVALNTSGVNIKIYHIDKKTGRMIQLSDLFQSDGDYLTLLTKNLCGQMKEQMKSDEMVSYWVDVDEPGEDWKGIQKDSNFYISKRGELTFVFDKYEVAPGAMGVVEMTVPTKIFTQLLKPEYRTLFK